MEVDVAHIYNPIDENIDFGRERERERYTYLEMEVVVSHGSNGDCESCLWL